MLDFFEELLAYRRANRNDVLTLTFRTAVIPRGKAPDRIDQSRKKKDDP